MVIEIGRHNAGEMQTRKEADGLRGDCVLRNDRVDSLAGVRAVAGALGPDRR